MDSNLTNGLTEVENNKLSSMLKDEAYIKEFCNYVIFEGMSKNQAWIKTFGISIEMNNNLITKMYRWVKKKEVQDWLGKANKSLEVDWIDKRVNALGHLYNIGMSGEDKRNIDALDRFLSHLNREENKIRLDINGATQVNIVQIVQDKLSMIVNGATISPNGSILNTPQSRADNAIDAILLRDK